MSKLTYKRKKTTTKKKAKEKEPKLNCTVEHLEEMVNELYFLYPKSRGKKKGVEKLVKLLGKDPELVHELRRAIIRYSVEISKEETPEKFIRMFSTFMNNWEDYGDKYYKHSKNITRNQEKWMGDDGPTLYGVKK